FSVGHAERRGRRHREPGLKRRPRGSASRPPGPAQPDTVDPVKAMRARPMLLSALAVAAVLAAVLAGLGSGRAQAAAKPRTAVSSSATPGLWRMARAGSPGSLVAFAVNPHTCPADAWLTLNGGDRAQAPHTGDGPCPALPAVTVRPGQARVPGPATVAAMPS